MLILCLASQGEWREWYQSEVPEAAAPAADGPAAEGADADSKNKTRPPRKQRGPPEDGIPSKTKVMVANLPYDLREDKVRDGQAITRS